MDKQLVRADARVPDVIQSMECNLAEFLLSMGGAGGGEVEQSAEIAWTIGGSPLDYHNAVVRADLSETAADGAIQRVVSKLTSYGVPGVWHLGPSMKPKDLGEKLRQAGWKHSGTEPGMAVALETLERQIEAPSGLVIRPVTSEADLQSWVSTLGQGFGEGPPEAEWAGEVFRRIGLGVESPWRHYVGFLEGHPVATGSVLTACGVAGLYFVMTVPEERRQGIGTAITVAALLAARAQGYEVGVLQASDQGKGIYESLAFRELCQFELWEMNPLSS